MSTKTTKTVYESKNLAASGWHLEGEAEGWIYDCVVRNDGGRLTVISFDEDEGGIVGFYNEDGLEDDIWFDTIEETFAFVGIEL